MSELPKVSVVIVTRNRADRLRATIEQVLTDPYPNREIVVVDGASTDHTVEVLRGFGDKVRWISERDSGEYEAWNKANRMVTGEILKWLPDDDRLVVGATQIAVDFLMAHPDIDMVWGQARLWNDQPGRERVQIGQTNVTDPRVLTPRGFLRQTNGLNSVAQFVRRRVVDKAGPLATDFSCGDTEFWARALRRGVKMAILPDVFAEYVFTGQNTAIQRNWRISVDLVRANIRHGNVEDVAYALWSRRTSLLGVPAAQHRVGLIANRLGFHPLRTLRKWRAAVAR